MELNRYPACPGGRTMIYGPVYLSRPDEWGVRSVEWRDESGRTCAAYCRTIAEAWRLAADLYARGLSAAPY